MSRVWNRRGLVGSKIMFAFFLFMLVVIAGGIAIGIFIFYGPGYDFRQADSAVLNSKIVDCISENGIDSVKADLYGECGFDKDVVEDNYVLGLLRGDDVLLKHGDYISCEFTGEKSSDFPECAIDTVGDVKIITGSNQRARRVAG